MDLVQQFNGLIWSWSETISALRRRIALAPLLTYAAAQLVVLLVLVFFAYPPFASTIAPLIRWRLGEAALHYPMSFLALRAAFGQADVVLSIVLGGAATAAATWLFASYYTGGDGGTGRGWREALKRYLPVLIIVLVAMALVQVVSRAPSAVWGHLADERPMRFRLLRMAAIAVVLAVQALFVYAIPYVVLGGRRLASAVGGSIALALKNPVTTYLIVAVPTVLEFLPAWLARNGSTIAYRFSPEALVAVLVVWVAVILYTTYFTIGAAIRFFLYATQNEGSVSWSASPSSPSTGGK
ncbi:hypothetical protein K8S17_02730 [bacterium]|nr:hypothetical protein [bacterium]